MARLLELMLANGATPADLGSQRIGRGEVLIRQGDASDDIYFVLAGRFQVERDSRLLGHVEPGSVVGDIGFFTGAARTASVVAFRDSLVLRLSRDDYQRLCDSRPGLRDAIITELATRFSDRLASPDPAKADRTRPRALALIGAGDRPIPARIAQRLAAGLSALLPAQAVSRADFRAATRAALDSFDAADWFSRTERAARITLYLPEPGDDDWQRAIVRQSDQLLIVGEAGPPPPLSPIESFAFSQLGPDLRRLVLLHPRRAETVSGTADWLRVRRVAIHHHVALRGNSDLSRLARFLSGQAVGLVLSGGGAYGLAHIGIREALAAEGIGFDILGGTSVGSAMAAAFALGLGGEELTARVADIFVASRALRRVTLPRYALLDHRVFDDRLAHHFGETDIADMWRPFFAVAANLATDREEVIRSGPLWQAIRASSALPGILPPFIHRNGNLVVDGGILDNLPVRAMREIKAGPNVVVSLARARAAEEGWNYARIPSRLGLFLDLLRPRRWRGSAPVPGAIETIMRAMTAGQTALHGTLDPQDWLLTPPLPPGLGFMNWKDAPTLIAPAAAYARARYANLATANPALHEALRAAGPLRRGS
ncbi:MAG: patatin-like phospholipase family protein [Pseudooceanicola sp.]|nr:patatin-like phospholipase family protein [Pseudooceanicola sp.]